MKAILPIAALLAITGAVPALCEPFDEQALVEAARNEPPLLVYDSTGKITEQAKAFAEKYGLEAVGTKSKVNQTIKIVSGEEKAGNVRAGVVVIADAPAAAAELVAPGYVVSYLPSDMAAKVPAAMQAPLYMASAADVFSYNTALNPDGCPVKNIWELTEPKWKGRIAMQDPLGKPAFTNWFNQIKLHFDDAMAKAYEDLYGKPLKGDFASATEAWVAALAKNQPLLTTSDGNASEAVGAPDTKENFIGLISTAKFRENKNGMTLGLCAGMKPFSGYTQPSLIFITKDAPSPNAAKLFVHYMLTAEGIAPQAIDGKISANPENVLPADEPSGLASHLDEMMPYDARTATDDWTSRQDWQDLWSLNHQG